VVIAAWVGLLCLVEGKANRLISSISPIPASKNPKRVASNADLFDFELDSGDMEKLDGLEAGAEGACSVKAHAMINGP
jgi:diketogulonate reductase-like aldo/keto reductase